MPGGTCGSTRAGRFDVVLWCEHHGESFVLLHAVGTLHDFQAALEATYAALAASTQGSPETRVLSVVSSGCGLGEYFGDFDRGAEGTKCVCNPSF